MAKAITNDGRLELDENEKRWLTVGIAMHTVVAPVFRTFVESSMKQLYNQHSATLQQQSHARYINRDPKSKFSFNYESANGNKGKSPKSRNYSIKDHHEFAKLHLKPHMAMFTSLGDSSCDISAILTIMAEASVFPLDLQDSAKAVRDQARNPWGHCHMNEWDEIKYYECFTLISSLVEKLGIDKEKEEEALDDLKNCQKKGMDLCFKSSTDEEAMRELKGCIETLTISSTQHQQDVHQTLGNFKGTIELKLMALGKEVTSLMSAQKNTQVSISQLNIQHTSHGKRLDVLEMKGGDFPWNLFKHKERIGYGVSGTVFKVTAMADEKVYALKQTHYPPIGKDFKRCKNEIFAISRLENPYIVRYNTSFQDHEGKIYIQMEFFGKDLKVCLNDSNLTLNIIRPQARRLLDQLLGGIDYIHSQGLIHRDLKPSNIFVVINEGVLDLKIGDFDLASFKDDEMSSFTGAPLYRAPEQEFNEYDNKVDMFTLGIVLFEVLKKKYGCSVNWKEYIWKLRRDAKGTLEEFEPYEPRGWKQLISALLERDPKGRPSAKFLLANLNSMLSEDKAKVVFIPETNIPGNRNRMALGDTAKSFKKGKPKICTIVNRYRDAYLDPEPDAYLEQYEPDAYLDPEPYSWQDNLHEPDEERYSWQDNLHEPDAEPDSWLDLHEGDAYL